jgi:PKD repeat protein
LHPGRLPSLFSLSHFIFIFLAVLGALPGKTGAQTPTPIPVSDASVGGFHVGLDYFENLTIAYEVDGEIFVETRGSSVVQKEPLGPGVEPHFAFDPLATHIVFATAPAGGVERRIHFRSRTGSTWSPAERLSAGEGEDRKPRLVLARDRSPVIAWEKRRAGESTRVWFQRPGMAGVDVGRGDAPVLLLDSSDRASIFFLKDGEIFHAREESSEQLSVFQPPRNITETPFVNESPPQVAVHDDRIYLAFEREGSIYLASDSSGTFRDPKLVVEGGASSPSLSISPSGATAFAFLRDGEVYSVLGSNFSFPEPTPMTSSAESESSPRIAIDSFANLFVGFEREESLFYTTDAGPPQARFETQPSRGEAPLLVRFEDQSTGDVTSWSWDFGDGSTSSDREPSHVYETSGEYVASLRVAGPGGESHLAERQIILVQSPGNQLRVGNVSVFPGQEGVHVPILATHVDPAQGFTVAMTYDPRVIEIASVDESASELSALNPELFAVQISEDPDDPYLTVGILIDVQTPFDGRKMPPGQDQRILSVVINVRPDAPVGSSTRLELRNQTGRPPLNNIFTVNGLSILPVLDGEGTISIERLTFPPPRFFIRGDSDSSGVVDLTDAVSTLNYLFGGANIACEDAADVTDDGEINVADPVSTMNYLFRSGELPAPPFPEAGLDPSADDLATCMLW